MLIYLSISNLYLYLSAIHISCIFRGDSQTKLPETSKVLIFSFNIPGQLSASERHVNDSRPLMSLVFYVLEKVRRLRLSREVSTFYKLGIFLIRAVATLFIYLGR